MKKLILSLIGAMFTCTAFAENCVTTTQLSTDYATQTVTFKLTWSDCNATTNHLNKVWCFIDFRATGSSSWTRAIISGTPAVNNGTYAAGNAAGFYITGANGQSATVTVKLDNAPDKFDWCAFVTDYPPNVATLSGTANTLKGSPSFVVNGSSIAGNQFTGTVNVLTDATGCPGCIGRDVAVHANIPCCPNLTAVGGYCRNLAADNAYACLSLNREIKTAGYGDYPGTNPCPNGWHMPTSTEAVSIFSCKTPLDTWTFWTTTQCTPCAMTGSPPCYVRASSHHEDPMSCTYSNWPYYAGCRPAVSAYMCYYYMCIR